MGENEKHDGHNRRMASKIINIMSKKKKNKKYDDGDGVIWESNYY